MNPHDDPKYIEAISETFLRSYGDKSLVLEPSEVTQIQFEVKLVRMKVLWLQFLGVIAVGGFDEQVIAPKWGRSFSLRRLGVLSSCLVAAIYMPLYGEVTTWRSRNLTVRLSWKYEQQLLELHPNLKHFYKPTPSISTNPSQTRTGPGSDEEFPTDFSKESSSSQESSYLQHDETSSEGSAYKPPPNVKDWSKSDWRGDSFRPEGRG
mmetsp:Transcript_33832/g.58959  ORF Transcript_33832/g.58959 Transcript_33832/m.58959 type:complete len:207 (+) Transcript_33832:118-738(+)